MKIVKDELELRKLNNSIMLTEVNSIVMLLPSLAKLTFKNGEVDYQVARWEFIKFFYNTIWI